MKRSGKKREGDISPDLTSFSDIANLLIIFFILTTSLVRPFGRPMDMPSSAKPPEQQQKSDTPTVRLTADRIVFSEGEKKEREVTMNELRKELWGRNFPQHIVLAVRPSDCLNPCSICLSFRRQTIGTSTTVCRTLFSKII